jgi:hypothetical protein
MNGAFLAPVSQVEGDQNTRSLSTLTWRTLAYAGSLVFSIAWTLALGKDVHWDALNYHLYLGFSALNDRFGLDFFAAGPPSYLNPYAYVPLYAMSKAGVPAMAMAVSFATFHAVILWLTFEIALIAGVRDERRTGARFAMLATILAAANPILLQQLGSTIIDISTGVLVVGGWLALAYALRTGRTNAVAIAGVLCGVAVALKLSNAVFAVAALPALAFLPGPLLKRVRASIVFACTCAIAFAVVAVPWGLQLWREFGNPVFPFYNHLFGSPDFTTAPLRYERFMPASWLDFVLRPFRIVSASAMVQTEGRAPDVRYAALIVALAALPLLALLRSRRAVSPGVGAAPFQVAANDPSASRVLLGLLTGLATAWVLWLVMSGNGRYFLPMACLASVALALVLQRLYALWEDGTTTAILVLLLVQGVQLAVGTDWKRDGLSWQGQWMQTDVPARFRNEPYLYLSAQFLSASAFAPHLHPASGMMNITGFNPLGPNHPGGARAQALIDRNIDRVRILVPLPNGYAEGDALPGPVDGLTLHVRRFGLRVDGSDCGFLKVEGNLRASIRRGADARVPWTYFLTCRLEPAPELARDYVKEVRPIDAIFDRVETACPNLFHPRGPVTEQLPFWVRVYNMGTEIQLWIEADTVKYFSPLIGGDPIVIGSVDEWTRGQRTFDCSRKSAPAFGGLLE